MPCADSLKKTARNFNPLRIASSTTRRPSMAQSPPSVRSPRAKAWRISLTRGL